MRAQDLRLQPVDFSFKLQNGNEEESWAAGK
jgi:hypothetical protein